MENNCLIKLAKVVNTNHSFGEREAKKISKKTLEENLNILDKLNEIDDNSPKTLLSGLVDSMQKNAEMAGIKVKKSKETNY